MLSAWYIGIFWEMYEKIVVLNTLFALVQYKCAREI